MELGVKRAIAGSSPASPARLRIGLAPAAAGHSGAAGGTRVFARFAARRARVPSLWQVRHMRWPFLLTKVFSGVNLWLREQCVFRALTAVGPSPRMVFSRPVTTSRCRR